MKEPTWADIEERLSVKLEALRTELEGDLHEQRTVTVRAEIRAIRLILKTKVDLNPPEVSPEDIY